MLTWLQRKYALSEQGAKDLIKGCIACAVQNISFFLPVSLLYLLVSDLMKGSIHGWRAAFYCVGSAMALGLIFLTTWFQYNATYFATYIESGVRRITLAEKLRRIPLSFLEREIWPT